MPPYNPRGIQFKNRVVGSRTHYNHMCIDETARYRLIQK